jgi:hypothetical protein
MLFPWVTMITNEPHYITTNGKSHEKWTLQFYHKQCNYIAPTQRENVDYYYRVQVIVILATVTYKSEVHTQSESNELKSSLVKNMVKKNRSRLSIAVLLTTPICSN